MHYAKLAQKKAIIEAEKIKLLLDMKNNKFYSSCKEFYKENNFLSKKQTSILYSKLTKSEKVILQIKELQLESKKHIIKRLSLNNDLVKMLKDNELFKDVLKKEGYRIVKYIEDEEEEVTWVNEKEYQELEVEIKKNWIEKLEVL